MGDIPPGCDFKCLEKIITDVADDVGIKIIGKGSYGAVFTACKTGKDCNYILKIQKADEYFEREVYAFYDLNGWKYSPIIYDAWTCGEMGFMILEKLAPVESCLEQIKDFEIESQLTVILDQLYEMGWVHVDTHAGNIMCKNGHLALVDFGWASKSTQSLPGFIHVDKKHPLSKILKRTFVTFKELKEFQVRNMTSAVANLSHMKSKLRNNSVNMQARIHDYRLRQLSRSQRKRYNEGKNPFNQTYTSIVKSLFPKRR